MKPEHDAVIEAMAGAIAAHNHADYQLLNVFEREPFQEDAKAAIQAAAERGYRLAKVPHRQSLMQCADTATMNGAAGWNECLDAIETITLDEEQDNG